MLQIGAERIPNVTAGQSGPRNVLEECAEYGPWNPGIRSQLPASLLPLVTIYRAENAFTSVDEAHERRAFTGLEPEELVTFRPERLVVHELLIRVTADISVPDGPSYEDLGINFRRIASTILARYLEPSLPEICRAYDALRAQALHLIEAELASSLPEHARKPETRAEPQGLARLFSLARHRSSPQPPSDSIEDRERRMVAAWQRKAEGADDPLARAAYGVLARLAGAILIQHGRLRGERTFLAALTAELTCNEHGSDVIGRLIEPHLREAALREGYQVVPAQPRPVVMNTKGASASGKSTMRPLQRRLAAGTRAVLERLRRHQPGHLAQVPPGLRIPWRREQICGHADRPRAHADRSEA